LQEERNFCFKSNSLKMLRIENPGVSYRRGREGPSRAQGKGGGVLLRAVPEVATASGSTSSQGCNMRMLGSHWVPTDPADRVEALCLRRASRQSGVVAAAVGAAGGGRCARAVRGRGAERVRTQAFLKLSTSARSPPAHTSRPPSAKPRAGFGFSACVFARVACKPAVMQRSRGGVTASCAVARLSPGRHSDATCGIRVDPALLTLNSGGLPIPNPELHASPDSENARAIAPRFFLFLTSPRSNTESDSVFFRING